jgi:hypothetical protein
MVDLADSLGARGRELWDELQTVYQFDKHEENMLAEVCRVLDVIEALIESIASHGVMVEGSQGQPVLNSAVSELRQQQTNFARMLPLLNLGEADSARVLSLTESRAKRAANARWAQRDA